MSAIGDIEKRSPGRPRTNATPVLVRLPPDQLAALDAWIEDQEDVPSRPAAIRTILERGLMMAKDENKSLPVSEKKTFTTQEGPRGPGLKPKPDKEKPADPPKPSDKR